MSRVADRVGRLRRGRGARAEYSRFRATVEPELNARGCALAFAAPPLLVPASGHVPVRLAVCIYPSDAAGAAERTRASLERQTVAPLALLDSVPDGRGGPWVALVSAGDVLADTALERLGQAVALRTATKVVTCDDDRLDRSGQRTHPRLRPGPSPDFWRGRDPDFGLIAVREAKASGSGPPTLDELALSRAGHAGEGHVHVPQILCHRSSRLSRSTAATGEADSVHRSIAGEASVEVIVCFRDRCQLLERSAGSLLAQTSYDNLAVRLVDNASMEDRMPETLRRLARDPRVTVDRDPRPFNFSGLNNAAAARSDADVVVFLNNDTEVISPDWIDDLVGEALRPEVGAVAPMLLYPDGRVQHAGVAIGIHGWAGHPFAGLKPDEPTPFGAASDGTRNWMAVTAACMVVEKRKFDQVGGFDESFAVGGGDVDLCLRLTAAGYRSLCVPHVRLIHDESASRDPSKVPPGDFDASRRSYGAFRTVGDPFYHPALTLQDTSCRLRRAGEAPPPP